MATTEAGLVSLIWRAIRAEYPNAWMFKVHGGPYQMAGVPDLLLCVEGQMFGFEVKHQKPGESRRHALARTTEIQKKQIRAIRAAGGYADTILSPDEALAMIKESTE